MTISITRENPLILNAEGDILGPLKRSYQLRHTISLWNDMTSTLWKYINGSNTRDGGRGMPYKNTLGNNFPLSFSPSSMPLRESHAKIHTPNYWCLFPPLITTLHSPIQISDLPWGWHLNKLRTASTPFCPITYLVPPRSRYIDWKASPTVGLSHRGAIWKPSRLGGWGNSIF